METPEVQFARIGDDLVAYQTLGDGPLDLIFMMGWVHNVETLWELPATARFFRRLSMFSRLILFDRRGTGLSDRRPEPYPFETATEDMLAILDAIGSERTAFLVCGAATRMAVMFAAAHPDRTSAVVTFSGHPTSFQDEDFPWGATREDFERELDRLKNHWGEEATIDAMLDFIGPSVRNDPAAKTWWRRVLRSTSRRDAINAFQASVGVDVRPLLPTIHVPVLCLHRTDDQTARIGASRYLADHIPGARFLELPGRDGMPFFGDQDSVVDEVEAFLTGARTAAEADRILATVLFSDIVGSTERAATVGDRQWRDLLDAHDDLARKWVAEFKGRIVDHTGDGFLAQFDGPARAIRCGLALRDGVRALGLETRAGVHTGEVEVRGDNIGGIAVHIGARVAAKAGAGEVWVSRTVADLVVGSSLQFEDRGVHALKGVPGEWQLYAVKV
jgi:class 3 adenylate cyclase/pimeloyl-ACP methyl ester carboxylesterase